MYLFKFTLAFLSVGGASYALIKANETPEWVKVVSILMAVAAFLVALPELPRAVEGIKTATVEIAKALSPAIEGLKNVTNKIAEALPQPAPRNAVEARPDPGGRPWCGVDPNGETLCCPDQSKRVVIEYTAPVSPYSGVEGVGYWRACY